MTATAERLSLAPFTLTGQPATSNTLLDSTTEWGAIAFEADATSAITDVGVALSAITGTPVATIGLQALDSGGRPTGTWLGGVSPANLTSWTPSSTHPTAFAIATLANSYSPAARGERIAIVLEMTTADASNSVNFIYGLTAIEFGLPCTFTTANSGTTWAGQARGPLFIYKQGGVWKGNPYLSLAINSTSTDGQRLAVNYTPAVTMTVEGIIYFTRWPAGGDIRCGIWNAAGTTIVTRDIDPDAQMDTSSSKSKKIILPTPQQLTGGTEYYIGIEKIASGATVNLETIDVEVAAHLDAYRFGQGMKYQLWNGSTWAATATKRPLIDLLISDIAAAGGGTASILNSGFRRGGKQ